jgi:hypothetical protein
MSDAAGNDALGDAIEHMHGVASVWGSGHAHGRGHGHRHS